MRGRPVGEDQERKSERDQGAGELVEFERILERSRAGSGNFRAASLAESGTEKLALPFDFFAPRTIPSVLRK